MESSVVQKESKRSKLFWFVPSLADTFFLAVFIAAFAGYGSELFSRDGDTGRHIQLGNFIVSTLSIPGTDVFSHTRFGQPLVPFEWLSEVIFAIVYGQLQLYGIALLVSAIVGLVLFILFRFMLRLGVDYLVAIPFTLLAAAVSSIHWLARPHIFTILLALAVYALLELHQREGRRGVLAIPVIVLVWANLHGGFLLAFALVAIYLTGNLLYATLGASEESRRVSRDKTKALVAVGALSFLGSLANPSGLSEIPHLIGYLRISYLVDSTLEYQTPNFHVARLQVFLLAILLFVAVLALSRRKLSIIDLATLVTLMAASLYSARNIPVFAVVTAPIIGVQATHLLDDIRDSLESPEWLRTFAAAVPQFSWKLTRVEGLCNKHLWPIVVIAVFVGLGIRAETLGKGQILRFPHDRFPVSAVEYIKREGIRGNMFNELNWGGYLLYTLYPDYKVFIDGQTDFYGEALTREYARVANVLPGWEQVLDRYDVRWVIFPTQSHLSWALSENPSWSLAYSDETASIFVRGGIVSNHTGALP